MLGGIPDNGEGIGWNIVDLRRIRTRGVLPVVVAEICRRWAYREAALSNDCSIDVSILKEKGKLMERCVNKQVYNYLITNNILTHFQSGFVKGEFTIDQLTYLYNDISKAIDNAVEVSLTFLFAPVLQKKRHPTTYWSAQSLITYPAQGFVAATNRFDTKTVVRKDSPPPDPL
ncbi:hypothetical protein DPMN_006913 [Dreissena polymorpha]|uniref:Reverse transcriptase domain-containing protein n=1 Tax=Dreissena polymorpha TaxID=45954 RepID=A0A9D4MUX3_DREPO|nr:hypothetical protein DPMN_006913 [Dreissena polymorpha]